MRKYKNITQIALECDTVDKVLDTSSLPPGWEDTIISLVEQGPLDAGDIPNKSALYGLEEQGYAARTISKGTEPEGNIYATLKGGKLFIQLVLGTYQDHTLQEAIEKRHSNIEVTIEQMPNFVDLGRKALEKIIEYIKKIVAWIKEKSKKIRLYIKAKLNELNYGSFDKNMPLPFDIHIWSGLLDKKGHVSIHELLFTQHDIIMDFMERKLNENYDEISAILKNPKGTYTVDLHESKLQSFERMIKESQDKIDEITSTEKITVTIDTVSKRYSVKECLDEIDVWFKRDSVKLLDKLDDGNKLVADAVKKLESSRIEFSNEVVESLRFLIHDLSGTIVMFDQLIIRKSNLASKIAEQLTITKK